MTKEKIKCKLSLNTFLLIAILIIGLINLVVLIENGEEHENKFEHYGINESIHYDKDFKNEEHKDRWWKFDFFSDEEDDNDDLIKADNKTEVN